MKIFLSFLQSSERYDIPAYSFWQYYIKNGIVEAGYEWAEHLDVDWAMGLVPKSDAEQVKWKQDTWTKTVEWLKKNPADIFLSYLYPQQIDDSAIRAIKKMGIPCVNFFCDHVRNFRKLPIEFDVFDLNWVPEYKAINLYKNAGYSYINLPMPMWVEPGYRVLNAENDQQIAFIGSKDIQRQLLLEELIKIAPGLPLTIYGSGWQNESLTHGKQSNDYTAIKKLQFNLRFIGNEGLISFLRKLYQCNTTPEVSTALASKIHSSLSSDDYNQLIATGMITLGINRYPSYRFPFDEPDTYSRLRDVEAPMLGACYLTEWTEGIEYLYDTQNEIATYRTTEELISKIRHLQSDANYRKKLKINGQKRALETNDVPSSLRKLKLKLNL